MWKETIPTSNDRASVQNPDKPKVPSYKDPEKFREALQKLQWECRLWEEMVEHRIKWVERDISYTECRPVELKIEA